MINTFLPSGIACPFRSAANVSGKPNEVAGNSGQRFRKPCNSRVSVSFDGCFDINRDHIARKSGQQSRLDQ